MEVSSNIGVPLEDLAAADEKYGGNGWSEVEKLVLYRLDNCEHNIRSIQEDIKALSIKRDEDAAYSRQQRTEQYENLQKSIRGVSQKLTDYRLQDAQTEKDTSLERATLRIANERIADRLTNIERIIYPIVGAGGIYIVGRILGYIF